jgi:hypothetical protein
MPSSTAKTSGGGRTVRCAAKAPRPPGVGEARVVADPIADPIADPVADPTVGSVVGSGGALPSRSVIMASQRATMPGLPDFSNQGRAPRGSPDSRSARPRYPMARLCSGSRSRATENCLTASGSFPPFNQASPRFTREETSTGFLSTNRP